MPGDIELKDFGMKIGSSLPFVLIAGPCQIEDLSHAMFMAENLIDITSRLSIPFIYKSSFDKANRSSISGIRGPGIDKGLEVLARVKEQFKCPVLTDVHSADQCAKVAGVADILQIPAFLCRQTDLLQSAAQTGSVVNVKKGQFLAPWDMKNVRDKLQHFGAGGMLFTERGTSFGYNTLVSDMRSLPIMSQMDVPVIFDATHSVQQPGGQGAASGGQRQFVQVLARAAAAVGVAGLFMEVHQNPDDAPSDGPCMLQLSSLEPLLQKLKQIDQIAKG